MFSIGIMYKMSGLSYALDDTVHEHTLAIRSSGRVTPRLLLLHHAQATRPKAPRKDVSMTA